MKKSTVSKVALQKEDGQWINDADSSRFNPEQRKSVLQRHFAEGVLESRILQIG